MIDDKVAASFMCGKMRETFKPSVSPLFINLVGRFVCIA